MGYKTKIGLSWKPVSKEALKRKSIQFKESPSDKSDNNQSKKKFAKTPIRVGGGGGGNRGSAGGAGVYAPPQGKYSSGLDSSMGKSNKVFSLIWQCRKLLPNDAYPIKVLFP